MTEQVVLSIHMEGNGKMDIKRLSDWEPTTKAKPKKKAKMALSVKSDPVAILNRMVELWPEMAERIAEIDEDLTEVKK